MVKLTSRLIAGFTPLISTGLAIIGIVGCICRGAMAQPTATSYGTARLVTPSATDSSAYGLLTAEIRTLSHTDVLALLPRFLALEPRLIFSLPIIPPVGSWTTNRLTSAFGHRLHPLRRQIRHHDGVDIAGPAQWIRSTAGGRVVQTGYSTTLGLFVRIDHGNSYETLFGHLQHIDVTTGSVIVVNTPIGISGHTGLTTGTHLHYAVRKNGRYIDPAAYMVAASKLITWYEYTLRSGLKAESHVTSIHDEE